MKMILEFCDNELDDVRKFTRAAHAEDAYMCLWEIQDYMRGMVIDPSGEISEEQLKYAEKIKRDIEEIFHDNKID